MYDSVVILGVIVSLIFSEMTGLSAGLVVPGYLALSLHTPLRLVSTLAVATASYLICRLLSEYVILYGRRRFGTAFHLPSVVGTLIPGIIAREIDRQGIRDALLAITAVTAATALLALAAGYPLL